MVELERINEAKKNKITIYSLAMHNPNDKRGTLK